MTANPDRVPTDAELLAAVAEGDREAFGTLHDQHAPWLLVRLRQRTTNQDLADQVAQETFLVVWRDAGHFRGRGEVGAWIWGIAIRRLLDTQRGDAAQGRLAGLLGRRRIPDAVSAEEQALATLEHRDVIRALNRLAPELQAVLQATVLDGLSTREAAVLLGIPAGTVKTRARRALAMLLGGLRAGEVRALRLTDVDQGLRRLRVCGKGGRQRVVPVERAFFVELAAYLRVERPPRLATPECFVVLAGATAGAPLTEAGLRSVFRHHRQTSGAMRVRPHRLRHTYGTELAAAGIDLLVLRELMGHASPETTAGYVHLSAEHLAAEYAAARAVLTASDTGTAR